MPVTRDYETTEVSGDITPTSGTVTTSLIINWANVPALLAEVFPPSSAVTPFAAELDPYFGIFRANRLTFKNLSNLTTNLTGTGVANFGKARVTITYSSVQIEPPQDQDEADADGDPVPFLTHSLGIGGEYITFGTENQLYWKPGSGARVAGTQGIDAGFPITQIEHQIHWHRVLRPPFDAIRFRTGKINRTAMKFATGTAKPGTMLFLGAEMSRDIMSDGARAWDVTYRFSERTYSNSSKIEDWKFDDAISNGNNDITDEYITWNHFWDDENSEFRVLWDANNNPMFETAVMSALFEQD